MRFLLFPLLLGITLRIGAQVDTIAVLKAQQSLKAVWKAPNGKFYPMEMVDAEESDILPVEMAFRNASTGSCVDATFTGVIRRKSKTTPHSGTAKKFNTLGALLTFLPSDASMINHIPPIDGAPDAERVLEERRNVRITKVWLLSATREDDNDYHLIIGNNENPNLAQAFLNVEVSGLPTNTPANRKAFKALKKVRESFVKSVGEIECKKTYNFPVKGVPIEIKGSLFFDKHHASTGVGSGNLRPATVWEIHPVTSIKWLDE